MWFLDLGFDTFGYFMCAYFTLALIYGLKTDGMRGFRLVAVSFIVFLKTA